MKVKDIPKWKRLREIFRKVDNNEALTDDEQRLLDSEAEFWRKATLYVTYPISLFAIIISIIAMLLKVR